MVRSDWLQRWRCVTKRIFALRPPKSALRISVLFSRHSSEFVNSAEQGCPLCWVLAGIGRSWDDSIDPATEIYVDLDDHGDAQVSCMKYQPSLHIYLPEEHCLGQSRNMPIDLLFAKT